MLHVLVPSHGRACQQMHCLPARRLTCCTPPARVPCAESLFADEHLEAALPRLTRLTSLALDKCELGA